MRGIRLLSVGILAVLLCVVAGTAPAASRVPEARTIRNWHAFTRLYGYVRWFCPSDEAAATDWDAFAVVGARRVRDVPNDDALRRELIALFTPIAPDLLLFGPGKSPPLEKISAPADSPWVAWQYLGPGSLGATAGYSPYKSIRLNRPSGMPSQSFGTVTNSIDAASLRGRRIRLRCAMRAEVASGGGSGAMWLRVDRPNNATGFFDNMHDRPVTGATWSEPEITGTVDSDAVSIYYGAFLEGNGTVEVDDFRLDAARPDGSWDPVAIANPGFESDSDSSGLHWTMPANGYTGTFTNAAAREGRRALRITSTSALANALFDRAPADGETWEHELVRGLRCRFALSLPSVDGHTLPQADVMALGRLRAELDAARGSALTADDEAVRVAGIAVLWNLTQHFWPYFDVVHPDWNGALDRALTRTLRDRTPEQHAATLRLMTAVLEDGHVNVRSQIRPTRGWTPLVFDWVEGRVVVSQSADPGVHPGDVVRAIDGRDVTALVDSIMPTRSGTERWRRNQTMRLLDRGEPGTSARFRLERDGGKIEVAVPRSPTPRMPLRKPEPVAQLEPGIWYVDLERSRMGQIDSVMTELASAKGVIFDARGYPNGTHPVLTHLSDSTLRSAIWQVPRVIRPDRVGPAEWDESGRWAMPPATPRFQGRSVFLIGSGAISYAESVLGIVENYRLGALVGEPTAGTNGNIATFTLPGGINAIWTGMRVLKHDRSQHMGVGIRPTVPVSRTIAGIRAGRDEVLERGLAIVRGGEARP